MGMNKRVRDYNYYRRIFRDRPLPLAFVDLDLLDQNIRHILHRAGHKKIRVASKSIRCVSLIRRILQADCRLQGVMCYSAAEAVHLSRQGLNDLLIAYPVCDQRQLKSIGEELRQGKKIALMVDCESHLEILESSGRTLGVKIPVCVDIDMSCRRLAFNFGVWRSAINTPQAALDLCRRIASCSHLSLVGIMGYEAQIAGVPDASPAHGLATRLAIRLLKRISRSRVAKRRGDVYRLLTTAGYSPALVNGGGTGSIESTRAEPWITEITVGSGFFASALFDYYRHFRHLPAAGYAIAITRRPQRHIFTCHGGGYIASGAVGRDKLPVPYLPVGAKLTKNEGAGEVQTPIIYRGEQELNLGDPIFMRHSKAGELCEHFNSLLLVAEGEIVDEVPTYRGEGCCFL